jgi:hypothetical protein
MAGRVTGSKPAVAYLVPWGTTASGRFLAAALRAGLHVYSTEKPFVQSGRTFPGGTLIVSVKQTADTAKLVPELASSSGAEAVATDTGWVEEGVNFGSRYVVSLKAPAIALAWDRPTAPGSAGHTRFVLERQYGYPVTVVRTQQLAFADLSKFQVIILPDGGNYGDVLGPAGTARLKAWVASGGALIGYSSAMMWMADPRTGLLALSQENLALPPGEKPEPQAAKPATPPAPGAGAPPPDPRVPGKILEKEEDYFKEIRPTATLPDAVAGVLVRGKTDPDHWLTAGVAGTLHALINGRTIFTPMKLDKGVNAVLLPGTKELLASGYLWEENRKQLAWKPLVVVQREGRGHVIGFNTDPNFRAYMDGLNVLFLNAVFRGPVYRPGGPPSEEYNGRR